MSKVLVDRISPYTPGGSVSIDGLTQKGLGWFDATHPDFGAKGDSTADDGAAINAAIAAALAAPLGGIVYLPLTSAGYRFTGVIRVPATTNKTIILRGGGQRGCTLIADGVGARVHWGELARDASGTDANLIMYGGIEELTITANPVAAGSTLLTLVEPQFGTFRNVLVQNATSGYGIKLLGSSTTGLGASAYPHAWRNKFYNVRVENCLHPAYLENADENGFYGCNFKNTIGVVSGVDTLFAIEIVQGRNNRWYDLLLLGDTNPAFMTSYIGFKVNKPINGDVMNNQVYGCVAEGFNYAVWVDGTIGGAMAYGTRVRGLHPSICNNAYKNVNTSTALNPMNQTLIEDILGCNEYVSAPTQHSPMTYITLGAGANGAIAVNTGDIYVITGNGAGSTLTGFTTMKDGAFITVRIDENVTLLDQANGGLLLNSGRRNITAPSGCVIWLRYALVDGNIEQVGPAVIRGPVGSLTGTLSGATPAISELDVYAFSNGGAVTVTNFTGSFNGKRFVVKLDANTTIQNNANIVTRSGANIAPAANTLRAFVKIAAVWYED